MASSLTQHVPLSANPREHIAGMEDPSDPPEALRKLRHPSRSKRLTDFLAQLTRRGLR
jgi:hypothetical protein